MKKYTKVLKNIYIRDSLLEEIALNMIRPKEEKTLWQKLMSCFKK